MSRNHLVPVLLLGLLTACSSVKLGGIGPHRIDVQQGNALDQESVAKLKPGLNRSQVRFLLGTPLLVDPFRTNRWDYVYTFYKGGKLAEQKRITLFFEDDILQRIEGDVPAGEPALVVPSAPNAAPAAAAANVAPAHVESIPLESVKKPEPVADTVPAKSDNLAPAPTKSVPAPVTSTSAPITPVTAPVKITPETKSIPPRTAPSAPAATSVVPPLSSSQSIPKSTVAPGPAADLRLHPETNVAQIQPDVIPAFPEPNAPPAASATDASVLQALKTWSDAWAQGSADAYLASYATDFVPPGGVSRADWEKRRRMLLGVAKNVDLRIESPKVKMAADGHALVTFNQYYRSKNYNDALVKQIKLTQRDGRWLIVDEQVVSTLQPPKP